MLGSVADSALQRARATLDTHRISVGSAPVIPALGDVETRDLARRYTRAMQDADIDTVIGLLTADATWSMPPDATWYAASTSRLTLSPPHSGCDPHPLRNTVATWSEQSVRMQPPTDG
jgi:hypothetical protein